MTSQDPTAMTSIESDEGPEGFREAKKKVETERDEAQSEVQRLLAENVAFKVQATGLDPNSGIGKSIVKDINRGEYEGDITPSALAAYASSEYGETIELSEEPDLTQPERDNELSKQQSQVDEIQTAGTSQPTTLTPPVDVISELQKEMLRTDTTPEDVNRAVLSSIALKAKQLQDDWKAGRIHTTPEP